MNASLKAMKALIASCTELFPVVVGSSEDGETSSSCSDLTPHDVVEIQGAAVGGRNQQVEAEDQVEDIMALTALPVSATEVVDLNATPVSSTVGKETLDGGHVAEVTPPNPPMIFHVVSRAWLAPPLAPEFTPGGPLSIPRALDVVEIRDHVGVIPAPNAHEVQVAPSRASFLATNSTDRSERRKQKKKEAKLKKRKDTE